MNKERNGHAEEAMRKNPGKFKPVPRPLIKKLLHTFTFMSERNLLERCIEKGTTNYKESIHNLV